LFVVVVLLAALLCRRHRESALDNLEGVCGRRVFAGRLLFGLEVPGRLGGCERAAAQGEDVTLGRLESVGVERVLARLQVEGE